MSAGNLKRLKRARPILNRDRRVELEPRDFILPYFIVEGEGVKEPIRSMPGVCRFSVDRLVEDVAEAWGLGVRSVLLFGIPGAKDGSASAAWRQDGVVQEAVGALKEEFADLTVITDVCLCAYTSHGHCGIVENRDSEVRIDTKATLPILAKIAVSHGRAGADLVAPSAMTDGQVGAIREALDREGLEEVGVLAYSAKYASNFYGPFRDALDSAPRFGDRRSYQLDFKDPDEAIEEIERDVDEGAEIVMVKPALAYLDIIYRAREKFDLPVAAYNVSGEYSLVKKLSGAKEAREEDLVREVLTAIKRAGADLIITYHAKEASRWLG